MKFSCSQTRRLWLIKIILTLTIIFIGILPILAQTPEKAAIILDGRSIFTVSQSGEFSAQQRAEEANRILQEIINNAEEPIKVEIDKSREIPVILVDGGHLLSVTSNDTPRGRNVIEQAANWQQLLETAIDKALYQRTPQYLIRTGLISVAILILTFFLNRKMTRLWHHQLETWVKQKQETEDNNITEQPSTQIPTQSPARLQEATSQVVLIVIKGIIWFLVLIYISRSFPQTRQLSFNAIEVIANSLVTELFSLGNNRYSFLDIFLLIAMLVALFIIAKTIARILKSRFLSLTGLSRAAQDTIILITNYIFVFIGIIVILQLWGLDISSLTVFAGVLGVGVGFGIQGIAKEFISGLILIFERPIQVGDFVDVGGLMGTVERISVRSTEIRTIDEIAVILPNSRFLESEVINWSHGSPISRLKIPVGVAYGSDLTIVRNALLDAAEEHNEVLNHPAPRVFFIGFGESALNFQLLVWIPKPYKQFQIKSDLYFIIDSIFRKREIEIPFPQRDLHLRSSQLSVPISPELIQSLTQLSQGLSQWLQQENRQDK